MGNPKHKKAHKQQAIARTLCKELKLATAYISHQVPPLEASGHPQNSWKNCCPRSDNDLFSSNNINTESREKVVRIDKKSPKGKFLELLSNSLNLFFMEMHGDQFGEIVCGYWG